MVFQLTWFRFGVTFGCFFLWMITRNWWGSNNFNYWAHCSNIRISIIKSKLLVLTVSFCENITRCAVHNSPSVVSLSLSLSLSRLWNFFICGWDFLSKSSFSVLFRIGFLLSICFSLHFYIDNCFCVIA